MLKLPPSYNWFALSVRPRWEKRVGDDLQKDGYEVYLPLQRTRRKWSDRMKWVDVPLFNGYLFVRVSHREYFGVLQHPAAMRYITFGGIPAVVAEEQVIAIRRALGEGIDFEVTSQGFRPGQHVNITAGPFSGLGGEVVRYAGRKSLLIRIGDTGLNMVCTMQAAFVEACVPAS